MYWPEDSTLHDGEIVGYDNVSLRHHVRYDCGDQEHVALKDTKVSSARCACLSQNPKVAAGEATALSGLVDALLSLPGRLPCWCFPAVWWQCLTCTVYGLLIGQQG